MKKPEESYEMWYFKLASLYHNDNLITDKLSRREAQFIERLMNNPNKIMTAEEIAQSISTPDYVRVSFAKIRKNHSQIPIKLIMNEGYMWYDDPKTFTTEQV